MVTRIGYFLSSEEFSPLELVEQARQLVGSELVADAGYDEVYINQIGPDQRGFFDFYATRILPQLSGNRG
jgi:hypothetical protein